MDLYHVFQMVEPAGIGWIVAAESHEHAKAQVIESYKENDVDPGLFGTHRYSGTVVEIRTQLSVEQPRK